MALWWQRIQHVNKSTHMFVGHTNYCYILPNTENIKYSSEIMNLDVFHYHYGHRYVTTNLIIILTGTFAPVRALWKVWVYGSVGSHGPIRDPGLVNASFHPLHDKIQQDVHSLVDVLRVCSTRLKVWDSARKKVSVIKTGSNHFWRHYSNKIK